MNRLCFERYARLLVEVGVGLQVDQPLFIWTEAAHRELALQVAEAGYRVGAATVSIFTTDPHVDALLIRHGRLEQIEIAHGEEQRWLNQIVGSRGALISLRGEEDPRLLPALADELPERHAIYMRSSSLKGRALNLHGINRSLCPWVVAGAATPGWAQQVFPALEGPAALDELWRTIFALTGADREDMFAFQAAKDRRLLARRALLDALKIRELHITGAGNDLYVGLSDQARWLGGSKTTVAGQRYQANIPTEENFTTPDRRLTRGRLAATMPFRTKAGLLVKDLVLDFEDGKVVDFAASEGAAAFGRFIDQDEGGRYLGEVALVGSDSPIAQSGLFFEHTLFDENAWPHVALGSAYTSALDNGASLGARELAALGCNVSMIHTDMMVGSPQVSIFATKSAEGAVVLIDNGEWSARFRT